MRRLIKKIIKLKSSDDSVSEVLGTVLLLGIAVAIFSVLYFVVLSQTFETNETYPTIVSTIVGDKIVFEHRGGDSLGLGATVPLTIDGQKVLINEENPTVGDLLIDANHNDQWDIGEILSFDYYDEGYTINSEEADAIATNDEKTDTLFVGSLDIHPTSNIKVDCSVNNTNPTIGQKVEITVTITHFRGNFDLEDLDLKFVLPDSLQHISNTTSKGDYVNSTGNWRIDLLEIRQAATLTITAMVNSKGTISKFTQLAIVLDGSGSIDNDEWDIVTEGLADALRQGYIPHNGMVELTIIQFGGGYDWTSFPTPHAEVMMDPVILDDYNDAANGIADYRNIADGIYIDDNTHLVQFSGYTPIACGFKKCARLLSELPDYDPEVRQVINLVTDGLPNCDWNPIDNDDYTGEVLYRWNGWNWVLDYNKGKDYAVDSRNFLIDNKLILDAEQDEIDALAVGVTQPDVDWLRDSIVWPEPGYDDWPPSGPGWVREIADFSEFTQALNEQFELIFSGITIDAEIINNSPIELIFDSDDLSVDINPKEAD